MKFCLPPELTTKFKQGLKSGEISPEKLSDMTSAERRSFLEQYFGTKNSSEVNAMFESKLLLKNQQQGIINWAKTVGNLEPKAMEDLVHRIGKMEKVLNPAEEKAFLSDLAAKKLKTEVTYDEAKQIMDLSNEFKQIESTMNPITFEFPNESLRLQNGRAQIALEDYVNDLKSKSEKLSLEEFKTRPLQTTGGLVMDTAGLAKSLKASLDVSYIMRQGWKTMFTNPDIWLKNTFKSFNDIYKVFKGKEALNETRAEIVSRPNAKNGLFRKEKLAVGVAEEAYPTILPSKIPVLGKIFKASEEAFTAFQYRMRADIFDKWKDIADKTGGDITGSGRIINSLTGRGALGKLEPVANIANNFFFSPRLFKSHIDTLTGHLSQWGEISPFARKQAAINLVKIVGGMATIFATAKAIDPKSVNLDPRSSDFGKIKVGDTRFDVSGGMAGLATLAARITPTQHNGKWGLYTKSSTTGKITKLNTDKFGSQTVGDVLTTFTGNKLSPAMSIIKDVWISGKTFSGKKPTVGGELVNLFAPLPITNYEELSTNPDAANIIAGMIADALGIGTNTY